MVDISFYCQVAKLNADLMKQYGEDLDGNTSEHAAGAASANSRPLPPGPLEPVAADIVDEDTAPEQRPFVLEAKLASFYSRHAPEKLANVRRFAALYEGHERELNDELIARYGEGFDDGLDGVETTPVAVLPLQEKIEQFYAQHAPEKVSKAPWIAEKFVGHERSLNNELMDIYGEGLPLGPTVAERLAIYYARHAPRRDIDVDAETSPEQARADLILRAPHVAAAVEEHELDQVLTEQYGVPLPPVPAADSAHVSLFGRLVLFYAEHAPDKLKELDEVEKVARGYAGNEAILNDHLIDKYGEGFEGFVQVQTPPPPLPSPSAEPVVPLPPLPPPQQQQQQQQQQESPSMSLDMPMMAETPPTPVKAKKDRKRSVVVGATSEKNERAVAKGPPQSLEVQLAKFYKKHAP